MVPLAPITSVRRIPTITNIIKITLSMKQQFLKESLKIYKNKCILLEVTLSTPFQMIFALPT